MQTSDKDKSDRAKKSISKKMRELDEKHAAERALKELEYETEYYVSDKTDFEYLTYAPDRVGFQEPKSWEKEKRFVSTITDLRELLEKFPPSTNPKHNHVLRFASKDPITTESCMTLRFWNSNKHGINHVDFTWVSDGINYSLRVTDGIFTKVMGFKNINPYSRAKNPLTFVEYQLGGNHNLEVQRYGTGSNAISYTYYGTLDNFNELIYNNDTTS